MADKGNVSGLNDFLLNPFGDTDIANASRLANRHRESIRFTSSAGWLVWDGMRWLVDEKDGEVVGNEVRRNPHRSGFWLSLMGHLRFGLKRLWIHSWRGGRVFPGIARGREYTGWGGLRSRWGAFRVVGLPWHVLAAAQTADRYHGSALVAAQF